MTFKTERGKVWKLYSAARYWPACFLIFFSILYFADVCIRASEKYFWYDELVTVYFSRLPNIQTIWNALRTGADSNPPPFYLVTRASEAVFGEGPIGTRVPEMIGFWVFCVCMFVFVSRRAGPLAGSIATLLPPLTGALYYAYEARPHALVLGCCGAALICWQRVTDAPPRGPRRRKWLTAFSLFLFVGFMMHAYALLLTIPFALAELFREFRSKIIDWGFWIALVSPALPAVFLDLRLQFYLANVMKGTPFVEWFPPRWSQVANFYGWLLLPCVLIVFFLFITFSLRLLRRESSAGQIRASEMVHWDDMALSLGFLLLPAFGILVARATHSPFFSRYFLSALAGICIIVGMTSSFRGTWKIATVLMLAVLVQAFTLNFSKVLWHRYNHWPEQLIEPSTGTPFASSPPGPLAMPSLLMDKKWSSLPIALLDPLEYVYLNYYVPELAKRVYCPLASSDNVSYRLIRRFRECCSTALNAEITDEEFLRMSRHFIVYGTYPYLDRVPSLQGKGSQIGPLRVANGHFLAEIQR